MSGSPLLSEVPGELVHLLLVGLVDRGLGLAERLHHVSHADWLVVQLVGLDGHPVLLHGAGRAGRARHPEVVAHYRGVVVVGSADLFD